MKNRVPNYLSRVTNHQIREIIERKKPVDYELMHQEAMEELKAIYWHEKELLIFIPILISNATTFELVEMLTVHIKYIREHIKQLEKKFPSISQLTPRNFNRNIIPMGYNIESMSKNTILR